MRRRARRATGSDIADRDRRQHLQRRSGRPRSVKFPPTRSTSHLIVGIRLWGVKFHRPVTRAEFVDEVTATLTEKRLRRRRPSKRSTCGRAFRSKSARASIVSGDLAQPTVRTVFSLTARRGESAEQVSAEAEAANGGRVLGRRVGARRFQEAGRAECTYRREQHYVSKNDAPERITRAHRNDAAVRSATVGVWADVGSALESARKRGISHWSNTCSSKAPSAERRAQIAETMDGVGGNLNAFTDKETTCYYAKVIDRHVPLALDVLADMFLNSTFDPEELAQRAETSCSKRSRCTTIPRRVDSRPVLADDVERVEFGRTDDRFRRHDRRVQTRRPARAHARALRAELGRRRRGRQRRARALRRTGGERVCSFAGACALPAPESAEDDAGAARAAQGYRAGVRRSPERADCRFATNAATRYRFWIRFWAAECRAAFSRDPRKARPGLHGLLVSGGLSGSRIVRRVRGDVARKRLRVHRSDRRADCARLATCGIVRRRAAAREGTHQGKFDAIAGVDVEPDDPARVATSSRSDVT